MFLHLLSDKIDFCFKVNLCTCFQTRKKKRRKKKAAIFSKWIFVFTVGKTEFSWSEFLLLLYFANQVLMTFLHVHLCLNREGRCGTIDDFVTSFLHISLFLTAVWDSVNPRTVYSLMLFSHLFFCLPFPFSPFSVPCKMVLARPDDRETCPYHFILFLLTTWSRGLRAVDFLLDFGTDFLIDNMVLVWNA